MNNKLYHHGIKGMKWGVRRFRRKDGSLTSTGKKRYSDSGLRNKKSNNNNNGGSSKRVKTAEKEYTGEKLKNATDKYRNDMLKKYTGKDPVKTAFYTNASDELLQQEFVRRENVKKAVMVGAAVVGVGAACVIAYKMSANKQVQNMGDSITTDRAKQVLKNANDDLAHTLAKMNDPSAYVIPKNNEIHRMTGFSDFDLSKTVGKKTYVTANDSDRAAYALFLKDWHGSGERYDVTLKATKDIIAPSDKKAREIFQKVYDSNPEYKQELRKTLTDAYAKVGGMSIDDPIVKFQVNRHLKDPFGAGMYAFVRQGRDSDILTEAYVNAGYSAIVDYFDKGSLGKQPMILFNAASDTSKVGEKLIKKGENFVTDVLQQEYVEYLRADRSHPMRKYV